MKFLNFNKVLCLSPHPDDIEYSMGGTIYKFNDTKFDILCMTQGTSTDSSSNVQRHNEVKLFWEYMGCNNIELFMSEYNQFEALTMAKWITYLDKFISNGYDAIFVTPSEDAHQEHIFVNSMVPALTRSKPISILEYKSPSALHSWIPNHFVMCDMVYDKKKESLQSAFISQMDSIYFNDECIRLFHMDYNCTKRNTLLTEQFKIRISYN